MNKRFLPLLLAGECVCQWVYLSMLNGGLTRTVLILGTLVALVVSYRQSLRRRWIAFRARLDHLAYLLICLVVRYYGLSLLAIALDLPQRPPPPPSHE